MDESDKTFSDLLDEPWQTQSDAEGQTKRLQEAMRRMRRTFAEQMKEERRERNEIAKRLYKTERLLALTIQIVMLSLGAFGTIKAIEYWNDGSILAFLSVLIIAGSIIAVIRDIEGR